MKLLLAAAAMFFLLPFALASQTPFEKLLNSSFEPDQTVLIQPLLSQGTYSLVKADGMETYVADSSTGAVLKDRASLQAILEEDAANSTGYAAKLASALSLHTDISAAKKTDEAKCMQYTGTDMHECVDKQTCTVSCLAVPLCSTPLYSDGFWEAILDWTISRKSFDSTLSSYGQGSESLSTDPSAIDSKLQLAGQLEYLAANMTANPLFLNRTDEGCSGGGTVRCYEYCYKVNYSLDRIRYEKQNLVALKSSVASVAAQAARADAILKAGREQDSYLASRGRRFEELRLKMQSDIRKLKGRAANLSSRVSDDSIVPDISSLENLSAQIVLQGKSELYRQALSGEAVFNQKATQLSSRMDSDESAYSSVKTAISDLSTQLDKSKWLLGNSSSAGYAATLANFSANLSSSQTPAQLAEQKAQLATLKSQLSEEVAEKAASQPGQQPLPSAPVIPPEAAQAASKLPCVPALAMLLLPFAFFRRGRLCI